MTECSSGVHTSPITVLFQASVDLDLYRRVNRAVDR
jgi:hypothetical protein